MRLVASTSVKLRPADDSRRAAAIPAAPAPTMITSTSAEPAGAAPCPNAGRAAMAAAPARKAAAADKAHGFPLMVCKWFLRRAAPNAIPIESRCRAHYHGSRFVAAIRDGNEPNCNEFRLILRATRRSADTTARPEGHGCHELDAQRHRAKNRRLSGARGTGLRAVHAERSGCAARHAPARRRAAGRRQQSHLRRHQVPDPIHLVARRALCRPDRRARRPRTASRWCWSRPMLGEGVVGAPLSKYQPLPHPHLPSDRAHRGRPRPGLHLRGRAHRLRL